MAQAGYGYTIIYTDSASGPSGEQVSATNPFIIPTGLVLPTPGKIRGTFYAMSASTTTGNAFVIYNNNLASGPAIAAIVLNFIPKTAAPWGEVDPATYNVYISDQTNFAGAYDPTTVLITGDGQPVQVTPNPALTANTYYDAFFYGQTETTVGAVLPALLVGKVSTVAIGTLRGCYTVS